MKTELLVDTTSLPKPVKKYAVLSMYREDIESLFNEYVEEDNVDTATRFVYGTRLDSGTPLKFVAKRKVDKGTLMRAGEEDWKSNYGGKNYWILKTTLLRVKEVSTTKITFEEVIVVHEGNKLSRFDTKKDMKIYIDNLVGSQNLKWKERMFNQ